MLTSRFFPAWYLGTFPDRRVMLCGYGDTFAANWGGKARNALTEAAQLGIFPHTVNPGTSAKNQWDILGHEGGLIAAGAGGAVTGFGADLLLLDDPVKGRREAESVAVREGTWQWYTDDVYTRLHPGASIVLVQTRWHHDDIAGRILARTLEDDRHPWEVLCLPAIAEPGDPLGRAEGEALWPERFDLAELEDKRRVEGSYGFNALYQQRPTPRDGGMFKRQWFEIVDAAPVDAKRVRFWDLAASQTKGEHDKAAGGRLSRNGTGHIYIEDMKRIQGTPGQVEALVKQTAELDGREVPIYIEQEPGSSGVIVIDYYVTKVLPGYNVHGIRSTGPKDLRAGPLAAQAEVGNVRIVRGPWNEALLDELCEFPQGAHDDQVDTASGGFLQLTQAQGVGVFF